MILVFGGTTEGRKAIEALEEAGNTFYYSTKTGEQDVVLHHGIRVDGAMDVEAMKIFCQAHDIKLLVDAGHPFAEVLHQAVAEVAESMHIPAIRFERIFPERDPDIVWLDGYEDAIDRIGEKTLLATTGVQSIARLKPLEEKGVKVMYRILPRESSVSLAKRLGATDDQLCFYEDSNKIDIDAEAILLKESGQTGGFTEKVEASRKRGMKIYAIKRPATPALSHHVNGEHGLRRMVEKLLPEFYPLHSGLTTGTCATAAAVAATKRLLYGEMSAEVPVILPNGETIMVPVGYGDGYAYCIKEAGDDPDVTDGLEIRATVEWNENGASCPLPLASRPLPLASRPLPLAPCSIIIRAGKGVGRFTLPGFDYPPGEPAINKGPRKMILQNLEQCIMPLAPCSLPPAPCIVTISVPNGAEVAKKTFNPRLGIEGGISIIGVSGIVKPFSEEAFVESIRKCMVVAQASGAERVVINSGGKSERFVRALYPDLPPQAFVEYGNYIGETLKIAHELNIQHVTLGVMLGKAVKLAAGHLDTHSRKTTMDIDFVQKMLEESGIAIDIRSITLARELWERIPTPQIPAFCGTVIGHCLQHCEPLLPNGRLTILLIADDGTIHSQPQELPQGQ